jgi:hypothetical protein
VTATQDHDVALVDDVLRRDHHNETIGILICGTKNDRQSLKAVGAGEFSGAAKLAGNVLLGAP